ATYRAGRAEARQPIGAERIAASAPFYVAESDQRALDQFGPALDGLMRESRRSLPELGAGPQPTTPREQIGALRFSVGSADRVRDELLGLREKLDFTALNLRPRWLGLSQAQVLASIELFWQDVRPALTEVWA